jgi:diguanylate cyclase (GGDEF)-like protein
MHVARVRPRDGGAPWWAVVTVIVAVTMSAACRPTTADDRTRSLDGAWQFKPGDDPSWASPSLDDRAWSTIQVPKSWGRQGYADVYGMAWYRTRVRVPWPADQPLALALGKIDSAYEVYVGGRRLGGAGRLPPSPAMEYDRHRLFVVPASTREPDGSLVVALRVWRADGKSAGAAGPVEGRFELGPIERVTEHALFEESWQLALVLLFAAVGVFHLALRLLRPGTAAYGWFGLLAIESAVYAFLRSQWKYLLLDDFVALKKTEHLMIYLVPATFLQFLWVFFGRPVPKAVRALQVAVLLGGAVMMAAPGLDVALQALPMIQVAAFVAAASGTIFIVPLVRAGDPEARLLGFGAVCVVLTIASDFLTERNVVVAPRMVVYGFAVLVFGMSLALANRFHRVLAEVDTLRRGLEQRVDERTQELSAAYSQMEALALHDGLTGLLNRRALQDRAHAVLAAARRQRAPFALALIDIDHFKRVNDTCGHLAGDEVLGEVARRLAAGVRGPDDVGRWGGEEFLMLLPDADETAAVAVAERLRAAVEVPVQTAVGPVSVTVSIGVAAVAAPELGTARLDVLVREADAALYRAKAAGRNRVDAAAA